MAGIGVRHLGDYIREQRSASDISLRQLAKLAGVSNPYLSQIERGLRKPSAEILQQIAKGLRISAEALYVQAGFLDQREGSGLVADAIMADDSLNERQKQVLLEIYESFRKENGPVATGEGDDVAVTVVTAGPLDDAELSTSPAPEPAGQTTEKPVKKTAKAVKAKAPTTPRATAGGRRASRTPAPGPEAPDVAPTSAH